MGQKEALENSMVVRNMETRSQNTVDLKDLVAYLKKLWYPYSPMINVQVQRNGTENTTNIIRRFTKKVQESGVLNKVRSIRYAERAPSPYVKKKNTLKKIRHQEEIAHLVKLGKSLEVIKRRK